MPPRELRLLCYLAPSLPRELFRDLAKGLAARLEQPVRIDFETRTSGPPEGSDDPFSRGEADLGFLCSPSYVWMSEREPASVMLLGAAPVFDDPRLGGRPAYYSDVVVRADRPIESFEELRGKVWTFNDACSLSGWFHLQRKLSLLGEDDSFFGGLVRSGSHLRSIDAVLEGRADATALDSNVLLIRHRQDPRLCERLRVIESWGPSPIQPIVLRRDLADRRDAIAGAMFDLQHAPGFPALRRRFGLVGFAAVTARDYELERRALLRSAPVRRRSSAAFRSLP